MLSSRTRNRFLPWLLLAPALVVFLLLRVSPLVMAGVFSLYKTNILVWDFRGLGQYVRLLTDETFWTVLGNTGLYMLCIVPAMIVFSVGFALMAMDLHKRVRHIARFLVYLPAFVSGVIIAQVWIWIFHRDHGLANWLLSLVGLDPVAWFKSRMTSVLPISFIQLISISGSLIIIFMASLGSVTQEIIEAAIVDGASPWKIKTRIKIPMISPTIVLVSVITMVAATQIFEWIYTLAPYNYAATVMFDIYHRGFLYSHHGLASAESMLLMAFAILIAVVQKRIQRWQF